MSHLTTAILAALPSAVASVAPSPSVTSSPSGLPSPAPTQHITIDVLNHMGTTSPTPGPWHFTLAMLITLIAAVLAAAGVGVAVWQRFWADRQTQLWNRMEWALGLVTAPSDADADEEDKRRAIGLLVLARIQTEAKTAEDEAAAIRALPKRARLVPTWRARWRSLGHGAPPVLSSYDRTLLEEVSVTYGIQETEGTEDEAQ